MNNTSNRRSVTNLFAVTVLSTSLVSGGFYSADAEDVPSKPDRLIMNVYSGPFEKCMASELVPAFKEKTGIDVQLVGSAPPLAKLAAQKDNPDIDVMISGEAEVKAAVAQGLLVELDLPGIDQLYDFARPMGVVDGKRYAGAFTYFALGLSYDKSQWKDMAPTSWFDLVSDKTPGRVAVRKPDMENTVAWLAIMAKELNGKWPERIEDYSGALALIKSGLKPHLATIMPNSAAGVTAFTNEHASLVVSPDSKAFTIAQQTGIPIGFVAPKEGAIALPTVASITKTKNRYWAGQLVASMFDPKFQLDFAKCGFFSPANKTVVLPPEIASVLVVGDQKLVNVPWDLITPVARELGEKFAEALN